MTKKIIALISLLAVLVCYEVKQSEKSEPYQNTTESPSYSSSVPSNTGAPAIEYDDNEVEPTPSIPVSEEPEEVYVDEVGEDSLPSNIPSTDSPIEEIVEEETPSIEDTEAQEQILKLVALTFDDGPGPYTSDLIDILEENDAHATFFVVGNRLTTYEDELNEIVESGNEIGIHTYSHTSFTSLGVSGTLDELNKTRSILDDLQISYSNLVRPPYGSLNDEIKNGIDNPFILWNVDTEDWKTKNAQSVCDAILKGIEEGNIILLHDIHKTTVEGVKMALPLISDEYKLVSVGELASSYDYSLEDGKPYYSLRKK